MIVTEVRLPAISPTSTTTAGSSRQQHQTHKCRHRHVGRLMLDFGKQAEVDRSGSSVVCTSRRGCVGSFHETAQMRQERLDSTWRQKRHYHHAGGGCRTSVSREGSESPQQKQKQSSNRLSSSSNVTSLSRSPGMTQARPHDRTLAAIKIQRAYRAHRAVLILKNFERRVREAFGPSRDSRATLSYLRARSAEFAAMRTFMSATPHVSDNTRVEEMIQRVSETIKHSVERAERAGRERETGATVVHIHSASSSPLSSPTRSPTGTTNPDFTNVVGKPNSSKTQSSNPPATTSANSSERVDAMGMGRGAGSSANVLRPGFLQNQKWLTRLPAETPPDQRRRRHSVASKVPDLLTIPEDLGRPGACFVSTAQLDLNIFVP